MNSRERRGGLGNKRRLYYLDTQVNQSRKVKPPIRSKIPFYIPTAAVYP